jgi:hypothetical protein
VGGEKTEKKREREREKKRNPPGIGLALLTQLNKLAQEGAMEQSVSAVPNFDAETGAGVQRGAAPLLQ